MSNYYTPPPQNQNAFRPHPYMMEPYIKPVRRSGNIIGSGLLMFLAVIYGFTYLKYLMLYQLDDGNMTIFVYDLVDQATGLFVYVAAFWIPTLLITVRTGIPANVAFPTQRPRASICIPAIFLALGTSVVGMVVSGSLSVLLESLTGYAPYMGDMPVPMGAVANVLYVINFAVAPAIFEELMFRGVILQSLRRFGDGFALAASSILFALTHGNLVQAPNALLMGLLMGYFVLRTGSVVTSILIHFVNNSLVVVWIYLERWYAGTGVQLPYLAIYGVYLLLGAVALVYLGVRHGNLFRVQPSSYPLSTGKKCRVLFASATMLCFVILSVITMLISFE